MLVGALFVGATNHLPLVILRIEQRLRDFMLLSLVDAVATPVLTVTLVVWLHLGIVVRSLRLPARMRCFSEPRSLWCHGIAARVLIATLPFVNAVHFGATLIPHAFAFWALLLLLDRGDPGGTCACRSAWRVQPRRQRRRPGTASSRYQILDQAMMPASSAQVRYATNGRASCVVSSSSR